MRPRLACRRASRRVRALDLFLVCVSAPLWLLTLAVVGLAVLVTSGRPVFFTQQRVGRDQKNFTLIKFRTMLPGPNPIIPSGERITRIGRILRRTSLDELPQLINVLRGDMSLVGPRPMLTTHAQLVDAAFENRFFVRPGLTGIAQVSGRNAIAWNERLALDSIWVEQISVRTAIRVLSKTGKVVVTGEGVVGHCPHDPFLADERVVDVGTVIELDSAAEEDSLSTTTPSP